MYKTVHDVLGNKYSVLVKDESRPRQEYLSFHEFNELSLEDQEAYIMVIRMRELNWMGENRVK